jgi:N-acetyl-gamma-glutamyl-phosphate reductase
VASQHAVFVDGQEGTTGLRIHEYLATRRDVEVLRIDPDKRKDAGARAKLLNAADVAFLCLPDAAAREAAALVTNPNTCLIDASTAHRTLPHWAFGLPELAPGQRERLRKAKRIANPGCHASAFILLLRPLVDAGLVARDAALSASSITGYSGGGKKMIEQYDAARAALVPPRSEGAGPPWERPGGGPDSPDSRKLESPRPYALKLAHKHIPEMMAHTGLTTKPVFMPEVAAFYKGLSVAVPLHRAQLTAKGDFAAVRGAYAKHYEGERFVRVLPLSDPATHDDGGWDVQACNDTNRVDIAVFADDAGEQAILMARLDNLGKGASGAAVQCMNLHLGVDEGSGL